MPALFAHAGVFEAVLTPPLEAQAVISKACNRQSDLIMESPLVQIGTIKANNTPFSEGKSGTLPRYGCTIHFAQVRVEMLYFSRAFADL